MLAKNGSVFCTACSGPPLWRVLLGRLAGGVQWRTCRT